MSTNKRKGTGTNDQAFDRNHGLTGMSSRQGALNRGVESTTRVPRNIVSYDKGDWSQNGRVFGRAATEDSKITLAKTNPPDISGTRSRAYNTRLPADTTARSLSQLQKAAKMRRMQGQ